MTVMKILCGKFLQPWEETLIEFQSRPSLSLHLLDSPCQQHQHDNAMVTMGMKTKDHVQIMMMITTIVVVLVMVTMPGCQHRGMEYCSGELMRGFTAWSFVQHCRCFIFSRCFDFLQVHFSCILIFCRYLEFSGILICSGIYIFSGVLIFSGILIFCMYLDFFIRIVVIQVF